MVKSVDQDAPLPPSYLAGCLTRYQGTGNVSKGIYSLKYMGSKFL